MGKNGATLLVARIERSNVFFWCRCARSRSCLQLLPRARGGGPWVCMSSGGSHNRGKRGDDEQQSGAARTKRKHELADKRRAQNGRGVVFVRGTQESERASGLMAATLPFVPRRALAPWPTWDVTRPSSHSRAVLSYCYSAVVREPDHFARPGSGLVPTRQLGPRFLRSGGPSELYWPCRTHIGRSV